MPLGKLMFLLCLVDAALVDGHMCTVGADYKYCYRVAAKNDFKSRRELVYTVHECRDICHKEGCIAFQYRASVFKAEQSCILFHGESENIHLSPYYDRCNAETWSYSWIRLPEPSNGHCKVSR